MTAAAVQDKITSYGYSTTTGTVTPSSTDTFTNKSGAISQWTNDSAYLTGSALTPYSTTVQVEALPVSTFTNDAGYITSGTRLLIDGSSVMTVAHIIICLLVLIFLQTQLQV